MTERDEPIDPLAQELEQDLLQRYGPVIGQDDLRQALGYASLDAFRQGTLWGCKSYPLLPSREQCLVDSRLWREDSLD